MVPIKKIKGKISNKIDGELSKVKKTGKIKLTFTSLKKVISSRIFKIKTKQKKTILTDSIFFKNV
jgi:hypothetical protein